MTLDGVFSLINDNSTLVMGGLSVGYGVLVWADQSEAAARWRLARDLRHTPFKNTPSATFSELSDILKAGEIIFPRPALSSQLVRYIRSAKEAKEAFIVGGVGGIGKSVQWEYLLSQRPLSPLPESSDSVWKGFTTFLFFQSCSCCQLFVFRRF